MGWEQFTRQNAAMRYMKQLANGSDAPPDKRPCRYLLHILKQRGHQTSLKELEPFVALGRVPGPKVSLVVRHVHMSSYFVFLSDCWHILHIMFIFHASILYIIIYNIYHYQLENDIDNLTYIARTGQDTTTNVTSKNLSIVLYCAACG